MEGEQQIMPGIHSNGQNCTLVSFFVLLIPVEDPSAANYDQKKRSYSGCLKQEKTRKNQKRGHNREWCRGNIRCGDVRDIGELNHRAVPHHKVLLE